MTVKLRSLASTLVEPAQFSFPNAFCALPKRFCGAANASADAEDECRLELSRWRWRSLETTPPGRRGGDERRPLGGVGRSSGGPLLVVHSVGACEIHLPSIFI